MDEVLTDAACFVVALVGMEGVAWLVNRHVMHSWLWSLHRSHHRARRGILELNDLFGVIFAAMAVGLFYLGRMPGLSPLWWVAAGMTGYGILYLIAHDGLVHRRWPCPWRGKSRYARRLIAAHRLHHISPDRDRSIAFGFLLAQDPARLSAELRKRRSVGA